MTKTTGTVFDIVRNSFVDGPGIRTTVFFKGCSLRCAWCHNPESQSMHAQLMVYKNKCTQCGICKNICPSAFENCTLCGACTLRCPHGAREICGREYAVDEVFSEMIKDSLFYENSGGGVTFSGGECLLQTDFLAKILKKCKENGIHTAVDTAGHVPFEAFEKVLPYTDLFLYDIKMLDADKHREYVGVGNEQILKNLKRLFRSGARVWIRIPVIKGVNDSMTDMREIQRFLHRHGQPERVELLPYHALGEHKYAAIGRDIPSFLPPDDSTIKRLETVFDLT